MSKHQKIVMGSVWNVELWRENEIMTDRDQENLVPDEFINYALNVMLAGGTPNLTWYIALLSNDHIPAPGDTYANPGFTESTGYEEPARLQWEQEGVASKSITNTNNRAIFTMDGTNPMIYGAALVSTNTKGDSSRFGAVLGPVAHFSQGPITGIKAGDQLRVFVTVNGCDV